MIEKNTEELTDEQKNKIYADCMKEQTQCYISTLKEELDLKRREVEHHKKRSQESDIVWKKHCNLSNWTNAIQTLAVLAVCACIVLKFL